MKRFLVVLLLMTLLLSSCAKKEKTYADDLPCAELADTVEEQIPVDFGYETFGGEHLRYYFEDTKLHDDACLRYTVRSEDIGEFGIFHTPDEASRQEIEDLCEDYLETLREEKTTFIESYAPEEVPKLERAEVRSFGNYTVYAILSDDDRELLFDTVEKKLVKE
ncbi:MAG: DUF4358 domain-containing protein [Clostridia bacterium]|nr:DUF4358 domain-containing protein [Clostridia bacterium]